MRCPRCRAPNARGVLKCAKCNTVLAPTVPPWEADPQAPTDSVVPVDPRARGKGPKPVLTSPWSQRQGGALSGVAQRKPPPASEPKIADVGFGDAAHPLKPHLAAGTPKTEDAAPVTFGSPTEQIPIENLLERTRRPKRRAPWEQIIAKAPDSTLRRHGTTAAAEAETPVRFLPVPPDAAPAKPAAKPERPGRRPSGGAAPRQAAAGARAPVRRASSAARRELPKRQDTAPTLLPDDPGFAPLLADNTSPQPVEARSTLILPKAGDRSANPPPSATSRPPIEQLAGSDTNRGATIALPWDAEEIPTLRPPDEAASIQNQPVRHPGATQEHTRTAKAEEMIGGGASDAALPPPNQQARADAGWSDSGSAELDAEHIGARHGSGADAAGGVRVFRGGFEPTPVTTDDTMEFRLGADVPTGPLPSVDEVEPEETVEDHVAEVHVTLVSTWRRVLGAIVDGAVVLAMLQLIALVGGFGDRLSGLLPLDPDVYAAAWLADELTAPLVAAGLLIAVVSAASHATLGRTLGKLVTGSRLVSRKTGGSPGVVQVVLRALVCVLGVAACGSTYLWILVDRERRTLHDVLTGTIVTTAS